MLYLQVYVCMVHTVYENPLLFLLNIKHGASQLYRGRLPNTIVRPQGEGRGPLEAPGGRAFQLSSTGTVRIFAVLNDYLMSSTPTSSVKTRQQRDAQ